MHRSFSATFDTEVDVEGLTLWRYRPNKNMLNYTFPQNYCFCPAFRWCARAENWGENWDLSQCENPCLDGTLSLSGTV